MGHDEHGPAYPEPRVLNSPDPPLWLRLIMVVFVIGALFFVFSTPY